MLGNKQQLRFAIALPLSISHTQPGYLYKLFYHRKRKRRRRMVETIDVATASHSVMESANISTCAAKTTDKRKEELTHCDYITIDF